ncbi:MAG: hypothetical protein PHO37_17935 [Kiritimatiellae bacterium]|nr:hypothetical protein [Kiritimatiellia bacterium]
MTEVDTATGMVELIYVSVLEYKNDKSTWPIRQEQLEQFMAQKGSRCRFYGSNILEFTLNNNGSLLCEYILSGTSQTNFFLKETFYFMNKGHNGVIQKAPFKTGGE